MEKVQRKLKGTAIYTVCFPASVYINVDVEASNVDEAVTLAEAVLADMSNDALDVSIVAGFTGEIDNATCATNNDTGEEYCW